MLHKKLFFLAHVVNIQFHSPFLFTCYAYFTCLSEVLHQIQYMKSDGVRPQISMDKHMDETVVRLMEECWSYKPQDRPSFGSIKKRIKETYL